MRIDDKRPGSFTTLAMKWSKMVKKANLFSLDFDMPSTSAAVYSPWPQPVAAETSMNTSRINFTGGFSSSWVVMRGFAIRPDKSFCVVATCSCR
jgi:hypothetical protein